MPAIEQLKEDYRDLIDRAQELFADVDEDTARKLPGENRWSMRDCIAHANAIAERYVETVAAKLDTSAVRDAKRSETVKQGLLGRLFTRQMEPPPTFRMKAPSAYQPQTDRGSEEVLDAFARTHEQLIALIDRMADQGNPRTWMSSPIIPAVILPLPDWFFMVAAHGRRHLWQAERAKEAVTGG